MQNITKILGAVSEETVLQTNQPIITNNTDLIGAGWPRSKKNFSKGTHIQMRQYKNVHFLLSQLDLELDLYHN